VRSKSALRAYYEIRKYMWKWIIPVVVTVHTSIAHAQTFVTTVDGIRTSEGFGFSIIGNMLLDGDSVPDFVVGAPAGNAGSPTDGRAYVFSGANFQLIRTLSGQSPPDNITHDRFGFSVASIGDLNSDGISDIVVGAPSVSGTGNAGYVRFFSGSNGSSLGVATGSSSGARFGTVVSSVSDVTGDGIPDVFVSAPVTGGTDSDLSVHRISGAGPHTSTQFTPGRSASMNRTTTGIADVNGDSFDDILVYSNTAASHSVVRVFSGDTLALISATCFKSGTLPSCSGTTDFGGNVLRLNDVTGDGVGDFAVSNASGLTGNGVVYIYSGADLSVHRTLLNRSIGDLFGSSLANMGDLDGDGVDDLLVGASAHTGTNQHNGYARAFSGKTGEILFTIEGDSPDGGFGVTVANAGDVNGNGVNDVLIGENLYSPNTSNTRLGRVHVYHSPSSLAANRCVYVRMGNATVCM
jgi:hypothetical protein